MILASPIEGVWGKSFPPAGSKGGALGQWGPGAEPLAAGGKRKLIWSQPHVALVLEADFQVSLVALLEISRL